MKARICSAIVGACAGLVGVAAAWAAGVGPGTVLGAMLGALAAAAGAELASSWLAHQVTHHLNALSGPEGGRLSEPLGRAALDRAIEALGQSIEQSEHTRTELADLDRLTRAAWAAVRRDEGQTRGPSPRQCLAGLIQEIRQLAARLARDAGALSQAAESMAGGAVEQTETIAATTSTVEALSDKIDRISQNAEETAEACTKAHSDARRGLEQVHSVIDGMERLRSQVETNGRKARRLGDRSVEIGTIVEMIRGISSRTDMLALNATIESVRAGEHGRGFAVVAEEIRKLAERTATSTREIGTIVEAIQADAHESIRALVEEQKQMEHEAQRVRDAGMSLERISDVAEHSARLAEGISRSTNDQVVATQDLVRAMQRISAISQQTHEGRLQSREAVRAIAQHCDCLRRLSAVEPVSAAPGSSSSERPAIPAPHVPRLVPQSRRASLVSEPEP